MLNMYPYPSGSRLHVGHGRNYILGDALYRRERMAGRKALNPMGWDAFGLPAENAAIQSGVPPARVHARQHRAHEGAALRAGAASTTGPRSSPPAIRPTTAGTSGSSCGCGSGAWRTARRRRSTGARAAGRCSPTSRSSTAAASARTTPVEIRDLTQWFFRVTDYAERLLEGLDSLPHWSDRVKTMQRNWIGRSEGAEILFARRRARRAGHRLHDAARHALRRDLPGARARASRRRRCWRRARPQRAAIEAVRRARAARVAPRAGGRGRREGGPRHGRLRDQPGDGETIPVWLANFVLPEYGTGAIMGVPAHDQRDFEFARQYGLPIRPVYRTEEGEIDPAAMTRPLPARGRALSTPATGTARPTARRRSAWRSRWLEEKGFGKGKVGYRLRDWLISRQRYWGTPIPAIHCPALRRRAGAGRGPAGPAAGGRRVPRRRGQPAREVGGVRPASTCPRCGGAARRETDTMDTFVDSSWYYLRFLNPARRREDGRHGARRPLDAGRPVHRRHRARDPAPALRALHLPGAEGHGPRAPRGAVRAALQPGDDHAPERGDRARSRRCRSRAATRSRRTS